MLLWVPLKWFTGLTPDYALAIRHITEYYDIEIHHIWPRLRWQHGSKPSQFL